MYKTEEYWKKEDANNTAAIVTGLISAAFAILAITFILYDRFVNRRNEKIVHAAARSNAIISSLFPTQVRDRLFAAKDDKYGSQEYATTKAKLKNMLTTGDLQNGANVTEDDCDFMYKTKPIADLFPETTILFADIVGFTAWSSVREPTQVFILLETLYRAFDEIAKKRRVFKVETVGDCYVAVTGLPDPRKDHAIAMARFARECMLRMQVLVKKLEVTLGPDTGDLSMRMGLHSGPVTAGVLRGERSRFQLFGDTMNTAARMEHTGLRDKIQISQETADLLIAAGKTTWVTQREDGKYRRIEFNVSVLNHRNVPDVDFLSLQWWSPRARVKCKPTGLKYHPKKAYRHRIRKALAVVVIWMRIKNCWKLWTRQTMKLRSCSILKRVD
jgi:class 3 adenylate cyclase